MRINNITISGRLTKDPEIKFTGSGKEIIHFCIAHNKPYKFEDEWQDETSFFYVKTNRRINAFKGDMVVVSGEISSIRNDDGKVWTNIFANQIMQPWKKKEYENGATQETDGLPF